MVKTIEVNGKEYKLTGEPSMRTVKHVQEMQIGILQDYIDDEQILKMDSMSNDEVMEAILDSGDGIENLKDMMWENTLMETAQTIMLATNEKISFSEFEEMPAMKFKALKEEGEIALGSESNPQDAADFMGDLGIGMSSRMKEIQEEAEEELDSSTDSSRKPLLQE